MGSVLIPEPYNKETALWPRHVVYFSSINNNGCLLKAYHGSGVGVRRFLPTTLFNY